MLSVEVWKDIPKFEGIYQISNYGRVRSFSLSHKGFIRKEPKLLMLSFTKDGYVKVRLNANGLDITARVHRLVAELFVPNAHNFDTVNHIDGNKLNNRFDNLEWADRSNQMLHAYKIGLKKAECGCDNSNSRLNAEDIKYIREHYKKNSREFGSKALGKCFNVSHRVILLIANNKTYKNIK